MLIWPASIYTGGLLFFLGYGRASHDFARVSHRQAIRQATLWPAYMIICGTRYWRWHRLR
jgi:hypothetical protein